mmetsp:Transcript_8592/g.22087  ORF Transcript_8592/g.22087 Transcript_8592/m.22087 type:complete len:282 (+) Transcript_8592:546-1391(+)
MPLDGGHEVLHPSGVRHGHEEVRRVRTAVGELRRVALDPLVRALRPVRLEVLHRELVPANVRVPLVSVAGGLHVPEQRAQLRQGEAALAEPLAHGLVVAVVLQGHVLLDVGPPGLGGFEVEVARALLGPRLRILVDVLELGLMILQQLLLILILLGGACGRRRHELRVELFRRDNRQSPVSLLPALQPRVLRHSCDVIEDLAPVCRVRRLGLSGIDVLQCLDDRGRVGDARAPNDAHRRHDIKLGGRPTHQRAVPRRNHVDLQDAPYSRQRRCFLVKHKES